MKKHIAIAVLASLTMAAAGNAIAQVAGSVPLGVTVEERKVVATGWSAQKKILGQPVYNDNNEKIGVVDDIIIAPDKAVSYFIIGVGGFLGVGKHAVAIPVAQIRGTDGKLTLPGATKEALKALPEFEYMK